MKILYINLQKDIGSQKNVSNMKILIEIRRKLLKINIEIEIFKYIQRFAFIEKDRYVFKAFQEENLPIDGWIKYMKTNLEYLGLGNLMGNIYEAVSGKISKEKCGLKYKYFLETINRLLHAKSILQLRRQ